MLIEAPGKASPQIDLIFPPGWTPFSPYLALPTLKSFLEAYGFAVTAHDLNLNFFDSTLSRSAISASILTVEELFQKYNAKPELSAEERDHYRKLGGALLLKKSSTLVDWAKDTFRGNGFFNKENYELAKVILFDCLAIASAQFEGVEISFDCIKFPVESLTISRVLDLLDDKTRNPFITYYDLVFEERPSLLSSDIVGISITSESQLIPALTLARMLKKHKSQHIILGGNYITRLAADWNQPNDLFNIIDSVALYEGELALLGIARTISKECDISEVPNLLTIQNGKLHRSASSFVDLEIAPAPDFSDFPLALYLMPQLVLPISTSRSCFAKCSFCAIPFGSGGSYRTRSVGRVHEIMRDSLDKYGTRLFDLIDETTTLPFMTQLAERIENSGDTFEWYCETRFSGGFTLEVCSVLRRGGLRKIQFGLESYNQRVLDLMQKGIRFKWIEPALMACMDAKIAVHLFFFVGFPGETRTEASNTLEFSNQILQKASERCAEVPWTRGWGAFSLERHSDVYLHPMKYGVEFDLPAWDSLRLYVDKFMVQNGMSRTEAGSFAVSKKLDITSLLNSKEVLFLGSSSRNLNSEEESFIRICSPAARFPCDQSPQKEDLTPFSFETKHPLFWRESPRGWAFYDPKTRTSWISPTSDGHDVSPDKRSTWLILSGLDDDFFLYDVSTERRIHLDKDAWALVKQANIAGSAYVGLSRATAGGVRLSAEAARGVLLKADTIGLIQNKIYDLA